MEYILIWQAELQMWLPNNMINQDMQYQGQSRNSDGQNRFLKYIVNVNSL